MAPFASPYVLAPLFRIKARAPQVHPLRLCGMAENERTERNVTVIAGGSNGNAGFEKDFKEICNFIMSMINYLLKDLESRPKIEGYKHTEIVHARINYRWKHMNSKYNLRAIPADKAVVFKEIPEILSSTIPYVRNRKLVMPHVEYNSIVARIDPSKVPPDAVNPWLTEPEESEEMRMAARVAPIQELANLLYAADLIMKDSHTSRKAQKLQRYQLSTLYDAAQRMFQRIPPYESQQLTPDAWNQYHSTIPNRLEVLRRYLRIRNPPAVPSPGSKKSRGSTSKRPSPPCSPAAATGAGSMDSASPPGSPRDDEPPPSPPGSPAARGSGGSQVTISLLEEKDSPPASPAAAADEELIVRPYSPPPAADEPQCAFLRGMWVGNDPCVHEACVAKGDKAPSNYRFKHYRLGGYELTEKELKTRLYDREAGELQQWLSGEIILCYEILVQIRNERRRAQDPSYPVCEFLTSEIMESICASGRKGYNKKALKRYWRFLPPLTTVDRLFIPINSCRVHWYLVVIYLKAGVMCVCDSMDHDSSRGHSLLMRSLELYMRDLCIGQSKMPENAGAAAALRALGETKWRLVRFQGPPQHDGIHCGVFLCANMDWLSRATGEDLDAIHNAANAGYAGGDMVSIRRAMRDFVRRCDMTGR